MTTRYVILGFDFQSLCLKLHVIGPPLLIMYLFLVVFVENYHNNTGNYANVNKQ